MGEPRLTAEELAELTRIAAGRGRRLGFDIVRRLLDEHASLERDLARLNEMYQLLANDNDGLERDLAELREAARVLEEENAAFARACGPISDGEPECPCDPYLDVDLMDIEALCAVKLRREARIVDARIAGWLANGAEPPKEGAMGSEKPTEREIEHLRIALAVHAPIEDTDLEDIIERLIDAYEATSTALAAAERERDAVRAEVTALRNDLRHSESEEMRRMNERDAATSRAEKYERLYERSQGELGKAHGENDRLREAARQREETLARERARAETAEGRIEAAWRAGYAFAEEHAEVSEHDGYHKHDARIEWPDHEQVEQAVRSHLQSLKGGSEPTVQQRMSAAGFFADALSAPGAKEAGGDGDAEG